jgi:hypothetical protein
MSKCLLFKSAKLNAYNNGVKNGLFNLPENFTPEKLAEREEVSEIVLYPIHTMLSVKGNKLVYNPELKKASNADLRDDRATLRLDNIRKNLPPMAIKIAKLTERELLDLAQEIIQVVQDKNRVRLEIVK